MQDDNNILVVRLSSLGDVLMTVPAVISIKNHLPSSHITWLIEGSVGDLLSYQGFLERVIRFPRSKLVYNLKKGYLKEAFSLLKGFVRELKAIEYDLIVDFHGIVKSIILSKIARGNRLIGFDMIYAKEYSHLLYDERINGPDKRLHKVERNMLIATYLGAKKDVPDMGLKVPDRYLDYIDSFFKEAGISDNVFAINPFSSPGSDFKRWGMDRYSQLIKEIRSNIGADILILWGPGEEKEAEALVMESGQGVYLACPTNIPQLFALLKRVRLYISGDTGVMHLAAAAKTPVIAIFGPTDHRINAPYGTDSIIVRKDTPCSPCKDRDCKNRVCLDSITPDEVFEAVKTIYTRIK
ncbi:MAG: glycosyltransferase family 9 protein [Syntrophorhabdaceae bacterium]|nr:glycosyltransferase family 9 protein [Syntrophorhabdaceae bacterium]